MRVHLFESAHNYISHNIYSQMIGFSHMHWYVCILMLLRALVYCSACSACITSLVRNTCNQYLCICFCILHWLILYFYLHVALNFPSFWYYNARRDVLFWWTSGCIYVRVLYEFACNQITCRRCSNVVRSVCMNKACFWWFCLYVFACVVHTRTRTSRGVVWSV